MTLHVLSPFLLNMTDDPDMNVSDIDVALREDWARQRTVEGWLKGELPFEAMLDLASDYGVDGYDYADMIEHNVETLIAQQVDIDDGDRLLEGLWLPSSA
jgi:hypothetical protein